MIVTPPNTSESSTQNNQEDIEQTASEQNDFLHQMRETLALRKIPHAFQVQSLIALFILAIVLPAVIYLTNQSQDNRQRASQPTPSVFPSSTLTPSPTLTPMPTTTYHR